MPVPDADVVLGNQRWKVPKFEEQCRHPVRELHAWSGDVLPETGVGNSVWSDGHHRFHVRFQLAGSTENDVYIKGDGALSGVIDVSGSRNRVIICGDCPWPGHLQIHVNGNDSTLYIGRGCTFNGTDMFLTGDDVSIICGVDCMFSHATMVRTYDQHAMFDTETREWLNRPQSVVIGQHVWIGQEVLLLKGATIGAGSIVGARSSVSGAMPAKSLSVGTPARVIRGNVSWVRDQHLRPDQMASVLTRLA